METLDILYVGDLTLTARSRMLANALNELGHRVVALGSEATDVRGEAVFDRRLSSRLLFKLGLPRDPVGLNRAVQAAVEDRPFDLLWVTKGLPLRPWTLAAARREQPSMRAVYFSEDDMFAPHNQSLYFRANLPQYDVVFTTKSYNAQPDELPAIGARRVVFFDKCYDLHAHRPVSVNAEERAGFGAPVGFIGSFEEDRASQMLYLAENGVHVRVFGNGWDDWRGRHPRLRIEARPLLAGDYMKGLCATDINLCFLRKANRDLQTDRTMEIPACGAFMLAERTEEHRRLFEEGREADYFSSREELLAKVRMYLADPARRAAVAAAGRRRCENSGYSFQARLPLMLAHAMLD